jgi:UDP-N-acetylglucosamine transferase subunit ALG13
MGAPGFGRWTGIPRERLVIFVTVGTDQPFDRLVRAVDDWAERSGRRDVFAQVGRSQWKPRHLDYCQFMAPTEFRRRFIQARIVVAHAGMGTILTALQYQKPIVIMPRLASLGEQRNEHQLATARYLSSTRGVAVAADEAELSRLLAGLDDIAALEPIGASAQPSLIEAVQSFIYAR